MLFSHYKITSALFCTGILVSLYPVSWYCYLFQLFEYRLYDTMYRKWCYNINRRYKIRHSNPKLVTFKGLTGLRALLRNVQPVDVSASSLVKGVNIQKNHVLMFYLIKKLCRWASTIWTSNDKQTGINRISQILRDAGTFCMTKILTHKTLFLWSRDPVGWEIFGCRVWISLTFLLSIFWSFKQFITWDTPTSKLFVSV